MKKSNVIIAGILFYVVKILWGSIAVWGRHSDGGGGITEAPRSVKMIDPSCIIQRFYLKNWGLK